MIKIILSESNKKKVVKVSSKNAIDIKHNELKSVSRSLGKFLNTKFGNLDANKTELGGFNKSMLDSLSKAAFNVPSLGRLRLAPLSIRSTQTDQISTQDITIDSLNGYFSTLLDDIQQSLFDQAKDFLVSNTHSTDSYEDFKHIIKKGGFVECGWDGTSESEDKIKKETKATIRCIPFIQNIKSLRCIYSNKKAKYQVVFARAY
mgnify:CR=1 FL=1